MKMNKLTVWLMTGLISLASFAAVADDKGKWQGGCPDWGYGMMGHEYGMMRGHGPMWLPDLKEDQQKKISAIYEELHKKRWDLMTKIQGEYATLRGSLRRGQARSGGHRKPVQANQRPAPPDSGIVG